VGYHNEHHDFPSIPWTRLPELRSIAKEFYEPLPSHTSWPYVTYKFISDPKVGMWSRAKRTCRGEKLDERVWTRMASGAREAQSEGGMSDGVTSDEDAVGRGMEEAVLRGYGSDHE
jgi:sphingolipid delta-4 desaturase